MPTCLAIITLVQTTMNESIAGRLKQGISRRGVRRAVATDGETEGCEGSEKQEVSSSED